MVTLSGAGHVHLGRLSVTISLHYLESCSTDDWQEIVTRAVYDAKDGDAKAQALLAGYLVGQPGSRGEMLHTLAVEVAAGSDPLRLDAARRRSDDARSELMHQSLAWPD